MSDRLIRIVRMLRLWYAVKNALLRIIWLANYNPQEISPAFLGPGFHSIELFIPPTLSAPNKAVKIPYSKLSMIYAYNWAEIHAKSIHPHSRKVKIERGSKVRDWGMRAEGCRCDSHGRWKARRKLVMYKAIQVSPNQPVMAPWGNWRGQYLSKGDKCWRTNLAPIPPIKYTQILSKIFELNHKIYLEGLVCLE
jgi:hypothetical protein